MTTLQSGAARITMERVRQINEEGYSLEHDRKHGTDPLLRAAGCYLLAARGMFHTAQFDWPWEQKYWKPSSDPGVNMEKAGALIAAALDVTIP